MSSESQKGRTQGGRPSILLVDDDVLVRLVIADYLRECGYRVIEAKGAEEALLVLQEPDIRVDILLSDVELRGATDGFGLAKWTRNNRGEVAVLLAGSVDRVADAAGELCDEGPLLRRPYEPQAIVDRIRRLLAPGRRGSLAGGETAALPTPPPA